METKGSRTIIYDYDGPPNVGHLVIRTPDDIKKLHPPDLQSHPRFREVAHCIGILKRESAGRWPAIGVVNRFSSL
jgi:uroporphyrinogen decarboxylase